MATPLRALRLLLVEDREDDADLIVRDLRRAGYDVHVHRVETADDMRRELTGHEWDVVISDYSMPQFSAPAALQVLHESGIDLPFIITSGTIGEETAVAALRAGAHDFMLKSRLARLAPAIEREMGDAAARRRHRAAQAELTQMEEQVRHSQKMDAVGRLAGGVAHDFNNILTAIIATADLAMGTPGLAAEVRADLETIRESGKRAAAITRQLLMFSRRQVVQTRPVDVNEVADSLEPMLKRLLPAKVEMTIRRASMGMIDADPTQIEQVMLNLVVNAGDAMPEGGTVAVATEDLDIVAGSMNGGRILPIGRYVVVRVMDSGIGMDEPTRSRIFEPFFTTKGEAGGTGLGLATVYGIVEQLGGHILLESAPGKGATFEVCMPRLAHAPDMPVTRTAEQAGTAGSEVILVVEDDTTVRVPICRALRQLGYFVLEANNGADALRVLQEYHAPVHLVVTDVMMPEMSGAELAALLRDWFPSMRVLFISGYSEEILASREVLAADVRYLAKPFTTQQLAITMRDLLNSPSGK